MFAHTEYGEAHFWCLRNNTGWVKYRKGMRWTTVRYEQGHEVSTTPPDQPRT